MSETTGRNPYNRHGSAFRLRMNLGANVFEFEGTDFSTDVFDRWLALATPPDAADASALAAHLTAKGQDITKFAEALTALAAKIDATAPAEPSLPIPPTIPIT